MFEFYGALGLSRQYFQSKILEGDASSRNNVMSRTFDIFSLLVLVLVDGFVAIRLN